MKSCDDFLKEVEERAARATKGPWMQCLASVVGLDSVFVAELICDQHQDKRVSQINFDGKFIAASRTYVEVLVRMVRAAKIKHCTCSYSVNGWLLRACSMCEELDRLAGELP